MQRKYLLDGNELYKLHSTAAIYYGPSLYTQKALLCGLRLETHGRHQSMYPPCHRRHRMPVLLSGNREHLIPVIMKMHAANSKGINILGAVIYRFSGTSQDSQALETCQITYITDSSD